MRRGHVIAQEVDVGLDRHRLAGRTVKVGRYPCGHHEVRVIAHEHVEAAGPEQPAYLPVEGP